jgi:hypothetical protein
MTILETVQIHLAAGSDLAAVESAIAARIESLSQVQHWQFGRNLEGSWGAGTHTLDLHWSESAVSDATLQLDRIAGVDSIDRVIYQSIGAGVREPHIENGIWRTLLLRTRPVAAEQVRALEQDLLRMPLYMQGIRNWRLSRVVPGNIGGGGEWTHVWQQEYARVDDLLGEYLVHPFHWAWVDRWFDMEFPEWTVDRISHAFCPLPASLLNAGH